MPAEHPLANLVNNNYHFFLYLAQHGTEVHLEDLYRRKLDWEELQRTFYTNLRTDERFNGIVLDVVARFLQSRDQTLVGFVQQPSYRLPIEDAVRVAVRFFYPFRVVRGEIQSYVCVGINGLLDYPGGRDLVLEAFAYSAIFHELLEPKYDVRVDYEHAKTMMNGLSLSSDEETRLLRAQGLMWGYMAQSERLRQVLLAEYQRTRVYLPFDIAGSPPTGN